MKRVELGFAKEVSPIHPRKYGVFICFSLRQRRRTVRLLERQGWEEAGWRWDGLGVGFGGAVVFEYL